LFGRSERESVNFGAIIRRYETHHCPDTDVELAWFEGQATLEDAVRCAALARDARGKRYSHQTRIKRTAIAQAEQRLLAAVEDLRRCESFDEVYRLVQGALADVYGIGDLYIYDTALRIGAWLGLLPEKVYLHAGVKEGAAALGLDTTRDALAGEDLPEGLRHLPAHEAEDILCIFKHRLNAHEM
jgi:hypothetical protein